MNKAQLRALRDSWVKALRSGEYEQTRNTLVTSCDDDPSQYCCLGVLASVEGFEDDDLLGCHYLDELEGTQAESLTAAIDLLSHSVDPRVLERLKSLNEYTPDDHKVFALLNDRLGMSFAEIADIIAKIDLED